MTPDLLARLREAQAAKRPVALLTRLPDGAQFLWPEDAAVPRALSEAAEAALAVGLGVNAGHDLNRDIRIVRHKGGAKLF